MIFTILLCFLLLLIYFLIKIKYSYWTQYDIPQIKPIPMFGNYKDYIFSKKSIQDVVRDICKQFPNEPYIGAFFGTTPTLIVQDPNHLKLILTQDFSHFQGREPDYSDKEDSTKTILFFVSGDKWNILRQNLTPLFSPARLKKMFYLIQRCTQQLSALIESETEKPSVVVQPVAASFIIDCIGSCVFGIDAKAMSEVDNIHNPFRNVGKQIFDTSPVRASYIVGRTVWPNIFYGLGLRLFPSEVPEFFNNLLTHVFKQRNYQYSGRHDFVDLVLDLKHSQYISYKRMTDGKDEKMESTLAVDDTVLCGMCTTMFAAGFESTANTLTFLLYELARNPDKQDLAIKEVDEYFNNNNKLEFECILKTPYLEACLNETLRLYPILGVITRVTVKDYVLPSGVHLAKGVRIHVPAYHMHRNPDYFPNPEAFIPERFLEPLKDNIKPYTYFPFGEGPRNCIGTRFAKVMVISGLLTVLRQCRVAVAADTPATLTFAARAITTHSNETIKLKFIRRDSET